MLDMIAAQSDANGAGRPGPQPMDGVLADFARNNPSLAWLPQMLAMQRQFASSAPTPEPDAAEAEIEALQEQLARAQARADKLQRVARQLMAELDAAQERLADVAAVVGACGLCWGEDAQCRSCRGRGKPGLFAPAPDPALQSRFFAEPVGPATGGSPPVTRPDHSERR
jgi:hypothetical protein